MRVKFNRLWSTGGEWKGSLDKGSISGEGVRGRQGRGAGGSHLEADALDAGVHRPELVHPLDSGPTLWVVGDGSETRDTRTGGKKSRLQCVQKSFKMEDHHLTAPCVHSHLGGVTPPPNRGPVPLLSLCGVEAHTWTPQKKHQIEVRPPFEGAPKEQRQKVVYRGPKRSPPLRVTKSIQSQ